MISFIPLSKCLWPCCNTQAQKEMTSPMATHPRAHTDRLRYGMVISGAVWLEAQGRGAEPGNVLAGLEPSSQEGRRKGRSFHTEKNRLDLSKKLYPE